MSRKILRGYAWLFFVCGLLFVFQERAVLGLISWAGAGAGLAPLFPAGPSLWLGLTGSLMMVISWLAYRLSQDPGQKVAWEALLLSKAASSSLFLLFAWRARGGLLAASAAVDGLILCHLIFLRRALRPRLGYEVWFARANDPATGRALRVRQESVGRAAGAEASCAAVFFDPASRSVVVRRWSVPAQTADISRASGDGASWDLTWKTGLCAPAAVVPSWLRSLGLSRSGYDDVAPDARFSGGASLDGQRWDLSGAYGCVGHVWGTRRGAGWWWAHAVFDPGLPSQTVLELLSARGPFGTRVTSACLWSEGELHEATGPWALFRNRSRRDGDRWSFHARFGALSVEGDCALGLDAALDYAGPDGRKLVCRNSKVSTMTLTLAGRERRTLTTDAAAVEFAEPAR